MYINRERERERERDIYICMCTHVYLHINTRHVVNGYTYAIIYIHMYIWHQQQAKKAVYIYYICVTSKTKQYK